jgi:hypothetical protein
MFISVFHPKILKMGGVERKVRKLVGRRGGEVK